MSDHNGYLIQMTSHVLRDVFVEGLLVLCSEEEVLVELPIWWIIVTLEREGLRLTWFRVWYGHWKNMGFRLTISLVWYQAVTPFEMIVYLSSPGTSIGALVGGLYAREGDLISSTGRAKQFSGRMGNIWRILSDVTYPIVAYTTASSLFPVRQWYHEMTFYSGTWIQPRFVQGKRLGFQWMSKSFDHVCRLSTTYISRTCGYLISATPQISSRLAWRYTRLAMPGASFVSPNKSDGGPNVLRSFIGASMTLVGLLPPLCDNGNLLVDGGYSKYLTSIFVWNHPSWHASKLTIYPYAFPLWLFVYSL